MELKAFYFYLTMLFSPLVASSVQASPVDLAKRDIVQSDGHINLKRGIWIDFGYIIAADLQTQVSQSVATKI